MSKAKQSPKTDKLKKLKEPKRTGPKKDLSAKIATNGLTTDQVVKEIASTLIIHYVSIEKDTNFLILKANDKNIKLPVLIDGDTFQVPVHKKFISTIQKLRPHAAMLSCLIPESDYKKISDIPSELYEEINITSVHFKYGGKKGDSIQINATLRTPRKKAFNFTTPIEYLESESDESYSFQDELLKIRISIFDRVEAYRTGEERGDLPAIGFFAETNEMAEESEAAILIDGKEHDVTNKY